MTEGLINQYLALMTMGAPRTHIGSGSSRAVFAIAGLPGAVFKQLHPHIQPAHRNDNARELAFWLSAPGDVRECLAPVLDYDAKTHILAMARTDWSWEAVTRDHSNWRYLVSKRWAGDVHSANVGKLGDRYVLHDYGHCDMLEKPAW